MTLILKNYTIHTYTYTVIVMWLVLGDNRGAATPEICQGREDGPLIGNGQCVQSFTMQVRPTGMIQNMTVNNFAIITIGSN